MPDLRADMLHLNVERYYDEDTVKIEFKLRPEDGYVDDLIFSLDECKRIANFFKKVAKSLTVLQERSK